MRVQPEPPELSFPVIWIGKEIRVSYDALHFHTCDYSLFKAGYRSAGQVIDAQLRGWRVRSSKKVGYPPPLWGFRLPGTRQYLLQYEYADGPVPISLDEVRELIIQSRRKSGFYEGLAGSAAEYEQDISRMESFGAICAFFGRPREQGFFRSLVATPLDG